MGFKAAIELGVIDTLYSAARADTIGSGSVLKPSEISTRLPTPPSNTEAPVLLDCMLRLLVSYSMVKCQVVDGERVYKAEPICKYFLRYNIEEMGTLASQFILELDSVFLNTWAQLKDVVLEGGDAFARANGGMKLFDYMGTDERLNKLFNRTGFSAGVLKKFLGVNVLVDDRRRSWKHIRFYYFKVSKHKGYQF